MLINNSLNLLRNYSVREKVFPKAYLVRAHVKTRYICQSPYRSPLRAMSLFQSVIKETSFGINQINTQEVSTVNNSALT